ncbi:hypothetical protein GGR53DRAFT_470908 [Hypoxylon sp. FL1150]|nr:hypothetical protein GGR53DRAFT_470908 [Hypoxylon sp. FL1150]
MKHATEWCLHANIELTFVDSGDSDILIALDSRLGSWSHIGRECQKYSANNEPSMNLGCIHKNRFIGDIRFTILHEFGHALGAIHEHSSPYAQTVWNREKVYQDLGSPPDYWNKESVGKILFTYYSLANPLREEAFFEQIAKTVKPGISEELDSLELETAMDLVGAYTRARSKYIGLIEDLTQTGLYEDEDLDMIGPINGIEHTPECGKQFTELVDKWIAWMEKAKARGTIDPALLKNPAVLSFPPF